MLTVCVCVCVWCVMCVCVCVECVVCGVCVCGVWCGVWCGVVWCVVWCAVYVCVCAADFNIQKFHVLPIQCIYVFCMDLRTNNDYFPIQHWMTGFYNRDLTLCSPVVTLCTTSLTFRNSAFYPHHVFMCFVWIWEQTAIISLYSINWLVFITEI
jgi:hypothetical protein